MVRRLLALAIALLAAAGYLQYATGVVAAVDREPLEQLPAAIDDWSSRPVALDAAVLDQLHLDDHLNREYRRNPDVPVTLYIGYYGGLHTGTNMGPHSPLLCLPGLGWRLVDARPLAVPVSSGSGAEPSSIVVTRTVAQNASDRLLVLFWYQIDGKAVPTELRSKVSLFAGALRGRATGGALVRVTVPISRLQPGSEQVAEREAMELIRAVYPFLGRHVPGAPS